MPEEPHKKEIAPYEGTGVLGGVKVGDDISYEISYKNYKSVAADVTIKDKLDANVEFVNADNQGAYVKEDHTVVWTVKEVPAGEEGKVTLTVKVLEGAQTSNGGEGKVVNGGETTTVQIGNDTEYSVESVENPVPEEPHKEETAPYEGTGVLGGVKVGDEITYKISYMNYKSKAANVVIRDALDGNVEFVSASNDGEEADGVVTWTIKEVPAGETGFVTLTVKVLEGALESNGGDGKVVNGGETTTVKVGNDSEYSVEEVENPVPEEPHKKEITPYEGTGVLGGVHVGDEITYEISYKNYKTEAAVVTIKDTLDKNVEFVKASNDGTAADGVVTWKIENVPAGATGSVTLTVKVLEGAQTSNGGSGKVVNGGESTTVQIGNDTEYSVEEVENPVPEEPHKTETAPYEGIGELGGVKVGDEITYEISYKNYKLEPATVTIKDTLDKNVEFVKASNDGTAADGVVTWKIENVPAGATGSVTLTVKVLEGALRSNGGNGKVVNGGESTTVQIGNDTEYHVEEVENPVPEVPHKKEITPYEGTGILGGVKVGDEITYEISYKNYKSVAADVTIKDKLDANVEFVSADNKGAYVKDDHTVVWTVKDVPAGQEGKVTLTVKVLEGALKSNGGAGKVVNGGKSTTVQIGNDHEYSVEEVENPLDITTATVTKIWDDSENQKNVRPDTIVLKLLANNELYHSFTIGKDYKAEDEAGYKTTFEKKDNEWVLKVENLPMYSEGVQQAYTWVEEVPEGYTISSYEVAKDGKTTITNTYDSERFCLTVLKVWDDDNNSAGFRPKELKVILNAKAGETELKVTELLDAEGKASFKSEYTLSDSNNWAAIVTGLPIYYNGTEITYSWTEDEKDLGKYTATQSLDETKKITYLTNTYVPETTETTVKKEWVDEGHQDKRPESIVMILKGNDKTVASAELKAPDWSATVKDLPKYAEGKEIDYVWAEAAVPAGYNPKPTSKVDGSTTTITNTYLTGSLVIEKAFSDNVKDLDAVKNLEFRIVGPDYDEKVKLSEFVKQEDGKFRYEIKNLTPGQYLVYETNADTLFAQTNPNLKYVGGSKPVEAKKVNTGETVTFSFTNNYSGVSTSVNVMKIWNDMDNLDGSRPESITMTLTNTGATVTLNEANGWSASIDNLDLYDQNGKEIEYIWSEPEVEGYTPETMKYGNVTVFINTHEPELTSVTVKKVWDDRNNRAKLRPSILRVHLSTGNDYYLTEDNNWTVTVDNLPKYKNGLEIEYTWSEQTVVGYTQSNVEITTANDGTKVTTFTNRYRVTTPPTPGNPPPTTPPVEIEEYETPLNIRVLINHVGDCFD